MDPKTFLRPGQGASALLWLVLLGATLVSPLWLGSQRQTFAGLPDLGCTDCPVDVRHGRMPAAGLPPTGAPTPGQIVFPYNDLLRCDASTDPDNWGDHHGHE